MTRRNLLLAVVAVAALMCSRAPAAKADEPFLGEIQIFTFNFCPRGYAPTNGQLLPINQNQALFALLGTNYGGDGRTTFALPDLRGSILFGQGQGFTEGQAGGTESETLVLNQLPIHNHTATTNVTVAAKAKAEGLSIFGDTDVPDGHLWARKPRDLIYSTQAPNVDMHSMAISAPATAMTTVNNAGGNGAHNNLQPYLVLQPCIALQGIFPPRN